MKAKLTGEDHASLGVAFCVSLWISLKQLRSGEVSDWMFVPNVICGALLFGVGIYIIRSLFTEMKKKCWSVGATWFFFALIVLVIEAYFVF